MIVRLKDNLIVITAETPEERAIIAVWAKVADGNVFVLNHQDQRTFRLTGLGPRLVQDHETYCVMGSSSSQS